MNMWTDVEGERYSRMSNERDSCCSKWKKTVYSTVTVFLLLCISAFPYGIQSARAKPNSIIVPDDYVKIKWAVGNATAGATIFVRNGTYYERLNINKCLSLVGESKESTIVDGNSTDTVIIVTVSNVVISGFTIRNSNRSSGTSFAGVKILGHGCNLTGNYITRNKIGISVTSEKSRIAENIITNNGNGIALHGSSKVTIERNSLSANTFGISLASSSDNMISGNQVANSSEGGHGIYLSSNSYNNTIFNNTLTNNYHGMWLSSSFNNTISKNTIANNELLGIELAISPDNTFYHNNFINNGRPPHAPIIKHIVVSDSNCTWDDGYPSGGNYWHDYTDIDEKNGPNQDQLGSDEIWDNPFVVDENNIDRYPSVKPYGDVSHVISNEGNLVAQAGPDKTVKVGLSVSFDASSSTGNIANYEWEFGDGSTGEGARCTHTYDEIGTYKATLTVTDAEGHISTDQLTVKVIADDASPPVDVSSPWISALAGVIVLVLVVGLFWKRGISKKPKRKKSRRLRAIKPERDGLSERMTFLKP